MYIYTYVHIHGYVKRGHYALVGGAPEVYSSRHESSPQLLKMKE